MPLNLNVDIKSDSVTKFIECVSKGLGAAYEPTAIVRKAKAEAQASLILAQAEVDKRELTIRAAQRLAHIETRRQQNIESITDKALKELPVTVSKDPVSEDWTAHFFESCQDVGEEEMQNLWARLLAGEVAQPRTFSRRTMETLRTFSSEDAITLTEFSKSVLMDKNNGSNLILSGLYFFDSPGGAADFIDEESHLVSLGLLTIETAPVPCYYEDWHIDYCGREYIVRQTQFENVHGSATDRKIQIRRFTLVGSEILKIIPRTADQFGIELMEAFLLNGGHLLTLEEFNKSQESARKEKQTET
jgi:uncharacterized protein DUF2806